MIYLQKDFRGKKEGLNVCIDNEPTLYICIIFINITRFWNDDSILFDCSLELHLFNHFCVWLF